MISVTSLTRTFVTGEVETRVLKEVSLTIETGEFVAIMGRSGAGKSTLLYQISLLDTPDGGSISIDETDVAKLNAHERSEFRLHRFGFVFQDYALLPELTALENVALPLLMLGNTITDAFKKAEAALTGVRLGHRLGNLPSQLSGGEQQRVSIARAMAHAPSILFADEPTANLDNESALTILEIFKEFHTQGQTIIMVTHEEDFAKNAERIITIDDGRIISDKKNKRSRE